MTTTGFNMTMQVRDYHHGVNLTEQLDVIDFEIEPDGISEISGNTRAFSRVHFTLAEQMEIARQIEHAAIYTPTGLVGVPVHNLQVKVLISDNNWVTFNNATLISIQYSFGGIVNVSWMFRESVGVATAPQELLCDYTPRPIPVQKLDWKKLGF